MTVFQKLKKIFNTYSSNLSIISTKYHFIVVIVSGFLATLSESIIGAKFQNKYKLSNELVNAIQTSIASIFAIFSIILYSYFLN